MLSTVVKELIQGKTEEFFLTIPEADFMDALLKLDTLVTEDAEVAQFTQMVKESFHAVDLYNCIQDLENATTQLPEVRMCNGQILDHYHMKVMTQSSIIESRKSLDDVLSKKDELLTTIADQRKMIADQLENVPTKKAGPLRNMIAILDKIALFENVLNKPVLEYTDPQVIEVMQLFSKYISDIDRQAAIRYYRSLITPKVRRQINIADRGAFIQYALQPLTTAVQESSVVFNFNPYPFLCSLWPSEIVEEFLLMYSYRNALIDTNVGLSDLSRLLTIIHRLSKDRESLLQHIPKLFCNYGGCRPFHDMVLYR